MDEVGFYRQLIKLLFFYVSKKLGNIAKNSALKNRGIVQIN